MVEVPSIALSIVSYDQLGFESYADYLSSPLWRVIRREVLKRDAFFCRVRGCPRKAQQVHHLGYSVPVLLGLSPFALVSVCKVCHLRIEYDGSTKRSTAEAYIETMRWVVGVVPTPGRSQPKIGRWFRDQLHANQPVAERILQCLLAESPDWYNLIVDWIRRGVVNRDFQTYLGLNKLRVSPRKRGQTLRRKH